MKLPGEATAQAITGLLSEFITDDDLIAKLNVEIKKIGLDRDKALLNASTTPGVDAFVKILIAFRDIIMPMLRPIGAACMGLFAAYCDINQIELDNGFKVMLYGAFPAWGASRHVHKAKQIENKSEYPFDD